MSDRLNQEREKRLEPKRLNSCKEALESMGFEVAEYGGKRLEFGYNGNTISHWPYSGWHSGKGIEDGRGFNHLLQQVKENED